MSRSLPIADNERVLNPPEPIYASYSGDYPWPIKRPDLPDGWYAELLLNGKWHFFNYKGAELLPLDDSDLLSYVHEMLSVMRDEQGMTYVRAASGESRS